MKILYIIFIRDFVDFCRPWTNGVRTAGREGREVYNVYGKV